MGARNGESKEWGGQEEEDSVMKGFKWNWGAVSSFWGLPMWSCVHTLETGPESGAGTQEKTWLTGSGNYVLWQPDTSWIRLAGDLQVTEQARKSISAVHRSMPL